MKSLNEFLPITTLHGIGDQKAKILKKLNIESINDLLHYYPRDYEEQKESVVIKDVIKNEVNIIYGEITRAPYNQKKKHLMITTTIVKDSSGEISVIWFNQPYMKNHLKVGQKVALRGKVVEKFNKLQMTSPEILKENDPRIVKDLEFTPIYSLTHNVSNKIMINYVDNGLKYSKGLLKDYLPQSIKEDYQLCEINYALNQIHFPKDRDALEIAKKRLIFDEFLLFQLGLLLIKKQTQLVKHHFEYKENQWIDRFNKSLPFQLTNAQTRVWNELVQKFQSPFSMNCLIQGDVGSGKTIIAAMALLLTVENGYQGCMMVPTAVLAKQHYDSLKNLLKQFDIHVALLTGSVTKKEKEVLYKKIKKGSIHIVVGTHAIIEDIVEFKQLALVITDEQHRFGVNQRKKLAGKGDAPHTLVMSATPIPRTLSLIVYGDMDLLVIDELPKGRKQIETYTVKTNYRERVYHFLQEEISKGRQAYIICPMIDEQDELDLTAVTTYTQELKKLMPSSIQIAMLHGKMKTKEKDNLMEKFSNGEIDLLVSTTVIEVGVDVPNATIMVIENAERFGLAQLHQLRGRVGRGNYQSYCILISDSKNSWTKKRLDVMRNYTDGFLIAEYDLKLRGPGDVLGIKQHGLPEFKLGSVFEDFDLLKTTQKIAQNILEKDPLLNVDENKYLKKHMDHFFKSHVQQIAL